MEPKDSLQYLPLDSILCHTFFNILCNTICAYVYQVVSSL
jgi:hypothetical protein